MPDYSSGFCALRKIHAKVVITATSLSPPFGRNPE
jgi:hypothetical protein